LKRALDDASSAIDKIEDFGDKKWKEK